MAEYQAQIYLGGEPVTEESIAQRVCIDASLGFAGAEDAENGQWLVTLPARDERRLKKSKEFHIHGEVADTIYVVSVEID